MARKKTTPERAVEVSKMVVPTCYIEEDDTEDAVHNERQRMRHLVSLGNGSYIARAAVMSDDL